MGIDNNKKRSKTILVYRCERDRWGGGNEGEKERERGKTR